MALRHMSSRPQNDELVTPTTLPSAMSSVPLSRADRDASAALGKRIAALRKKKSITQTELSKLVGVTQPQISSYEIGRLRPPHDFIAKVAEALDVSIDEIFGVAKRNQATEDDRLERRFARRLKLVKNLPKRDQDALLRTMDAFLERGRG